MVLVFLPARNTTWQKRARTGVLNPVEFRREGISHLFDTRILLHGANPVRLYRFATKEPLPRADKILNFPLQQVQHIENEIDFSRPAHRLDNATPCCWATRWMT